MRILLLVFVAVVWCAADLHVTIDCSNVGQLVHLVGGPFARGTKKEVVRGRVHGVDVVVARPFAGAYYLDEKHRFGGNRTAVEQHYAGYFRSEHQLLTRANSIHLPRLYGGCWHKHGATLNGTMLVEEFLRGFIDAASDSNVNWKQRLRIAANTLRVLSLLDAFPVDSDGHVLPSVYGDLFAKQFALDAAYNVKFVDVHSFLPYSGRGFGAEQKCANDADCHAFFWTAHGSTHVMRGLRKLEPDDFGCNPKDGRCRGLDSQTVMMALCSLLIGPMFDIAAQTTPKDVKKSVAALLQQCSTQQRAKRASRDALIASFESLIPSDYAMPPLPLVNADIEQYSAAKMRFEEIRHDAVNIQHR